MAVLRFKCPVCGSEIKPEDAVAAGLAWKCAEKIVRFGYAGSAVWEYVGLFRLPKRGLPWERVDRLLGELLKLWEQGSYKYNGCTYKAEKDTVYDALQRVISSRSVSAPLKDHNYLKAVLHPLSQKADAAQEQKTEERRQRLAVDPVERGNARKVAMPPEVQALIDQGKIVEATEMLNKLNKRAPAPEIGGFKKV